MLKYIIKRLLLLLVVLFGVTLIVFTLLYFTPGNPAEVMLGNTGSEEALKALEAELGLDKSYIERFGKYLSDIVLRGDFGKSYTSRQPVIDLIKDAVPNTLRLATYSTLFSLVFGLLIGIISALKQYTWIDNLAMGISLAGISMPSFWLAMLLVLLFSVTLGWLPATGISSFKHYILPVLTLGLRSMASIARTTRSSMLEVIRQDYITTARAKGQKETWVIINHALRNALLPVLTVVGLNFGEALGGAVVIESIFSIPGIGTLTVNALKQRNYSVVQGGVLYIAFMYSIINLVVDLLYTYIDPRLRSRLAK